MSVSAEPLPLPRMVDVSKELPSVAAAMEIEDDAVWKESIETSDAKGGRTS